MTEALQEAHDELERRVEERTTQQVKTNAELKDNIAVRKAVEETLITTQTLELRCDLAEALPLVSANPYSLEVEVVDSGTGIPPDILGKVFDPFFTTKDPDKGTGLGVAICKSMVEEFDGSIQIQLAPGAGTTVTILLPVVEQPRVDEAERKGQEL